MNLFTGCFSTSICIYFKSFRGFLIRGPNPLAGFYVVQVFAGGIFKQTCLKIANHLIPRAYNKIVLTVIGVTEF